jgi:hypothetical protein
MSVTITSDAITAAGIWNVVSKASLNARLFGVKTISDERAMIFMEM